MSDYFEQKHQKGYQNLLNNFKNEYRVVSVIGFGSYFRKPISDYGDIDLLILVEDKIYHKFFTVVDETVYDVTVINKFFAKKKLLALHQFFLRSFHESVIILDVEDFAGNLKLLASQSFVAEKPIIMKENSIMLIRSRVRTLLLDMEDNLRNQVVFDLILASLVSILRDAVCLMNNDWATTYAKNALREIAIYQPRAAAKLESALKCASSLQKYDISRKVALDILHPVGGLLQQDEVISLPLRSI